MVYGDNYLDKYYVQILQRCHQNRESELALIGTQKN